ncbi:MAG TPA: hypothetical protein VGO93_10910 [Candidatus Xenobia bacterium]|jgi:hypothetical protein
MMSSSVIRGLSLAAGMAAALPALAAAPPPHPVDTVTVENNALPQVPTRMFHMGKSVWQAHAQWAVFSDDAPATVTRTPQQISIEAEGKHLTIAPAKSGLVAVHFDTSSRSETHPARLQAIPGGLEVHSVDGSMDLALHQLPGGRLEIDATGLVPGTAHLFLTPSA